MEVRGYQIDAKTDQACMLLYGKGGPYSNSTTPPNIRDTLYIITTGPTNIYSSKTNAVSRRGKQDYDTTAIVTASKNVAIKVIYRDNVDSDNHHYIVLRVDCGNAGIGYVCLGTAVQTGANRGDWYGWGEGPYTSLAMRYGVSRNVTDTEYMEKLKLYNKDTGSSIVTKNTYSYTALLKEDNNTSPGSTIVRNYQEAVAKENYDKKIEEAVEAMNEKSAQAAAAYNTTTSDTTASTDPEVSYENSVSTTQYDWSHSLDAYNFEPDSDTEKGIIDYSAMINVFGLPYQLHPNADCRVLTWNDNLETVGYEFFNKIVSRMPLLYIQPGNTAFMGNVNKDRRKGLITSLLSSDADGLSDMLDDYTGKLYSIVPAYKEYFNYVNPMCRAGAIFLEIGNVSFETTDVSSIDNKTLNWETSAFQNMNWALHQGKEYTIYEEEETTEDGVATEGSTDTDYSTYFKTYTNLENNLSKFEKKVYQSNSIAFYINSDSSFQDSFTNETTESSLSSTINALSDKAREIQFLLGTATSAVGQAFERVNMDEGLSNIKTSINNIVNSISGGNSIFSTIANSVRTIVSGGRMLFPQIWSNSTFSRSYSVNIKLVSPSADPISWYLNCYVPMCHLLGLVCPRSEYTNSYTTPFLIRAFYKGMFNIDMGIITEMTFNKGKEGSWSADALPLVIDVSMTIQDLYSSMGITSSAKLWHGSMFKGYTLENISELDYLSNLCGINFYEPDIERMATLWAMFNVNRKVVDTLTGIKVSLRQYVNNSLINAYNNFWF